MLYEITLQRPNGTEVTEIVDLSISQHVTWREFCEHREFLQWKRPCASWPVIDITPEDLIAVAEPVAEEIPTVEAAPAKTVLMQGSEFIDAWSGRTTSNPEFTRWRDQARLNGISDLTFKSRVYKLGYDYARAATQPRGRQGSKLS